MLATLSKYEGQRDRLALGPETTPQLASPKTPETKQSKTSGRAANPFELPPEPAASAVARKMTTSRKDRRRKVQKLVDRIKDATLAGDWERELGDEIKVERSEVAAGKMTRFARVSRAAHHRPS